MKNNKLAFFTLILICLFSLNLFAQKAEITKSKQPCSIDKLTLPSSVNVHGEAFSDFIKVMSLPDGKKQALFSDSSIYAKANVIKVSLALQFIKRPNLNSAQKDLIAETISTISAETYNKENLELVAKTQKTISEFQEKAFAVFSPQEVFEIFANMNGDKTTDIEFLKKYEEILSLPAMNLRQRKVQESSPEIRSQFWKAQMIYYLATAKLNKAQQGFIINALPFLTARAFDLPKDFSSIRNEENELLKPFQTEALKVFTKSEAMSFL